MAGNIGEGNILLLGFHLSYGQETFLEPLLIILLM